MLIKRRDTIGRIYLAAINPIVDPRLDEHGRLTFSNAAIGAATGAAIGATIGGEAAGGSVTYRAAWMRFDNATGQTSPLAETRSVTDAIDAPSALPTAPDSYIEIDLSAEAAGHPSWSRPIRTWFRRDAGGWTLVGLERLPDARPELSTHARG